MERKLQKPYPTDYNLNINLNIKLNKVKVKYKYEYDNKACETCGIRYEDCESCLE